MVKRRSLRILSAVRWLTCGALLVRVVDSGTAQTITPEGPLTVVRSGTNNFLTSFSFDFDSPPGNSNTFVTFDFGFGTDEPQNPQTFYDSFSATLQETNQSSGALLFTADRSGTQWAPPNSGGLTIAPGSLTFHPVAFPALNPTNASQFAYFVSFLLPPELSDGVVTLIFDFFDNLSQVSALAFVGDLQIVTNSTSIPPPALQSSAALAGPFTDELKAVIDTTNKVITLAQQVETARFFRVRSDLDTVITRFQIQNQQLLLDYAFQPAFLALQSATSPAGPFVDEPSAVVDILAQTVSLPFVGQERFFRIRSNPRAIIAGEEFYGDLLILHFQFQPKFLVLQSSPAVVGPYADAGGMTLDAVNRRITIPQFGAVRFFRLRSSQQNTITSLSVASHTVVIHYQ